MAKLMAVGPLAVAFSIAGPAFYSFSPPQNTRFYSFFLYLKQRKSVISFYPGCVSVLAARVCVWFLYRSAESLRESNASRPSRANSNFCFFPETFLSCRNLVIDAVIPTLPASPSADDTKSCRPPFCVRLTFFYNPNKHGQH
jgi:hypothetical protein